MTLGSLTMDNLEDFMRDLKELAQIDRDIRQLKEIATRLKAARLDFPALVRNADRIMASTKMLELNVSDLLDLAAATSRDL